MQAEVTAQSSCSTPGLWSPNQHRPELVRGIEVTGAGSLIFEVKSC